MNLKTIKIIAVFNIFIISVISHFTYDIFPNIITSIVFPVNESIFEHMKIIFTSTIIYGIIDYLFLKLNNIKFNNFFLQLVITSIISIPIFLILYLPIHFIVGEYLIITITLLFITYIIAQLISYYLLTNNKIIFPNSVLILLFITIYIIFFYLTYNPPKNYFFKDLITNTYGIEKQRFNH